MEKNSDAKFFEVERLKDLGDGIFAFAMTILIVTLDVPRIPIELLKTELLRRVPDVLTFVLSFFLLAIFWMTNHIQMKKIKSVDGRLVWINIVLFLLVVFVPFTTDLYTFYDGSRLAMLAFNLNILFVGLIFLGQWHHLAANNLHHDDFTAQEIKDRYQVSSALITVALLAIVVGLFYPVWSPMVYLLLFFYRLTIRRKLLAKK